MNCCCYGCTKRAVGCRETCEAWAEHERQKAERYAKKEAKFKGCYGVYDSPRLKAGDKAHARSRARGYK